MILVTWDACVFTAADIDKIVAFQVDFDPVLLSPNPLLMYSASVKDSEMPIADWLPYPPQLHINIGCGPIHSSDRTSENEKVKVGPEIKWIKIVPLQWI